MPRCRSWRQPANGPHALVSLYRTVDTIWFATGDRTTDFGFYTKRALLAGVYLSTLLYWLNDNSEGSQASWDFLDRRIADVMRVQTVRARLARFRPPELGLLRRLREAARAAADPMQDARRAGPAVTRTRGAAPAAQASRVTSRLLRSGRPAAVAQRRPPRRSR